MLFYNNMVFVARFKNKEENLETAKEKYYTDVDSRVLFERQNFADFFSHTQNWGIFASISYS